MHPLSFEHNAKGTGIDATITASYPMTTYAKLQFLTQYQTWKTSLGQDKTYFVSGTTLVYPLNQVNWHARFYGVAFVYLF